MRSSRRAFLVKTAGAASGLGLAGFAFADGPAKLTEADPTAASLGYKADATKADKAKYASYAPGQMCSGCQLYQGKPGAAEGPCNIFAGKLVSASGWCSAYTKKA